MIWVILALSVAAYALLLFWIRGKSYKEYVSRKIDKLHK